MLCCGKRMPNESCCCTEWPMDSMSPTGTGGRKATGCRGGCKAVEMECCNDREWNKFSWRRLSIGHWSTVRVNASRTLQRTGQRKVHALHGLQYYIIIGGIQSIYLVSVGTAWRGAIRAAGRCSIWGTWRCAVRATRRSPVRATWRSQCSWRTSRLIAGNIWIGRWSGIRVQLVLVQLKLKRNQFYRIFFSPFSSERARPALRL